MNSHAILSIAPFALAAFVTSSVARAADPTTGDCLSASESALALRNQHKLRAARSQLLVCAAATCPADVRNECVRRVTDVNAAMPTIVFEAKDGAGNDIVAVKVTMDGQPLAERLEGVALSIDPGEHTFTFEAAGQPTVQKQFVIREGAKDRRERIDFGSASAAAAPSAPPRSGGVNAPQLDKGTPPPDTTKRTAGFIVGGIGLAGVGVGVTLLILASSSSSRSLTEDAAVPGSGHSDHLSAIGDQTAGFVAGGVGIVAVGAAIYMVLSRPSPASAAPETSTLHLVPNVGSRQAGLALGGTF